MLWFGAQDRRHLSVFHPWLIYALRGSCLAASRYLLSSCWVLVCWYQVNIRNATWRIRTEEEMQMVNKQMEKLLSLTSNWRKALEQISKVQQWHTAWCGVRLPGCTSWLEAPWLCSRGQWCRFGEPVSSWVNWEWWYIPCVLKVFRADLSWCLQFPFKKSVWI